MLQMQRAAAYVLTVAVFLAIATPTEARAQSAADIDALNQQVNRFRLASRTASAMRHAFAWQGIPPGGRNGA